MFAYGFSPQGSARHRAGKRDSILVYYRPFPESLQLNALGKYRQQTNLEGLVYM
jgi:hypothetical protein